MTVTITAKTASENAQPVRGYLFVTHGIPTHRALASVQLAISMPFVPLHSRAWDSPLG
jgi:hypothetical protein